MMEFQENEKTITNNINRFKDQSPTDTLANLTNTLGETGTNDFLLSLVQSGVNKTGGYDEILARSTFGGLTEDEYNMLIELSGGAPGVNPYQEEGRKQ